MFYFLILFIIVLCIFFKKKKGILNFNNEHFLITGGSSGIGLAMAVQCGQLGANVSIIARSKEKLGIAKEEICSKVKSSQQKILIFSEDISKKDNCLEQIIKEAENVGGPITSVINCAGSSISHRFEDTSLQDFSDMMDINYIGSINMTKAVLPLMKERKQGRIVFVSSLAGLVGLYGYTAYSGSKFAIRGLAEALQMEVKPYDIRVTLAYPPDTDTPCLAEENKTKPLETARISESAGLFSAEEVAAKILHDVFNNRFTSSVGFMGWMLTTLCSGSAPVYSYTDLIIQVITMGIFRFVIFFHLKQCDQTIKNCKVEREKIQTTEKEKNPLGKTINNYI